MIKNRNFYLTTFLFLGVFVLISNVPIQGKKTSFHSKEEVEEFSKVGFLLPPLDSSLIFPAATNCNGCHGFDPQMNGMVTSSGEDVNVHDDWKTTMMANSAKDPFWRAKVSHEILVNPEHSLDLQTKCTSCHAPQGHFTAMLRGAEHYTIDEMIHDTIAIDGVSCGACHMKSETDLDKLFSGEANYDTTRVIYGPYPAPFAPPMDQFVGFRPEQSEHINDAALCASCHTLLTNSVDLDGQLTGDQFVEQATYHEWVNSVYDDEGSNPMTCQSCHMPRLEDQIVISANYLFLEPRAPYALHDMIGSNTTMIQLLKENKEVLNIDASDEHFDETISKTLEMLQKRSIDTELMFENVENDTVYFSFKISNKAGHKFPSGYPSRRAYVEVILSTLENDTIFTSGILQDDYELDGQMLESTEPHFNVITSPDQVQIYELVLGDVNGDFTTVLERSHQALKDNRLPPLGFSTTHSAYDTTRIYGNANNDLDFNYENGIEGSGSDVIHYNIPLDGFEGFVNISAKVYYQALPPKWMNPMFAFSTPEIEAFKEMYDQADLSPVLLQEQFLDSIYVSSTAIDNFLEQSWISIYPNPSENGWVNITASAEVKIKLINVYDSSGKRLRQYHTDIDRAFLSDYPGLYIIEVLSNQGRMIERVLVN